MPDTSPDALRDRLAPHLRQDFDAVWAEWVEETGHIDPDAFVAHLVGWGLVPAELASTRRTSPLGAEARTATPDATRRARFRRVGADLRETGGLPGLEAAGAAAVLRPAEPNDRYDLVGLIGEGAMGRIELVRDRQLARRVAFKRMAAGLEAEPVLRRRFEAEARITAQLDHPGIVPVYTVEGEHAYTMKWVEGRTVRGLLEEGRAEPRSVDRAAWLDLFVRVCETLAYAHARGVLHRDLKPENVMVGRYGETWVMDWGIARICRTDVEQPVEVVQDDEGDLVIGTPGYMSPEQAAGKNDRLGPASDQYAAGLLLHELLALRPAVSGKNAMALVTRQQEGEHDPLPAGTPADLVAIVERALQKAPARRYPSMEALAEDVRRFQRGQPVSVRPEGVVRKVLRVVGRRADLLVAGVIIVLGLAFTATLLAVSAVTWRAERAEAAAQATRSMATTAASHTRVVEGQLLKFEGLVSVLATLAVDAGDRPPGAATPVWSKAFDARETAPADAVTQAAGDKYGPGLVSAYTPVFVAGRGADPAALPTAARLVDPARRTLPRVLLRSHDERRAIVGEGVGRRTILDVEIPARRAWIWDPAGFLVAAPGQAWTLDPATDATVEAGLRAEAPLWIAPHPDTTGRPVFSVVVAVPDEAGGTPGVAGVDLSAGWFTDTLLLPEVWRKPGVRGFLLDDTARVVAATDGTAPGTVVFPTLAAKFADHQSGDLGDEAHPLLAHRLATSGWWSVIAGDREALTTP